MIAAYKFVGNRIVDAIESILDILIGQWIFGIVWRLVPVRTLLASFALAFHPERTNVRSIAAIEWRLACQFAQHFIAARYFAQLAIGCRVVRVGQLIKATTTVRHLLK